MAEAKARYYKKFGVSKKKDEDDLLIRNLYKQPIKDKGGSVAHHRNDSKFHTMQADLLFFTNDRGYRYILVTVDVNSRLMDAVPLKTKTAAETLHGFKTIFSRGILPLPKRIEVDDGTEFKGVVDKYFQEKGVYKRVADTNRHRVQAIVEARNKMLQLPLYKKQIAHELATGQQNTEWVDFLPKIVKALNKNAKARGPPRYPDKVTCKGDSCTVLDIGDKVRVKLDAPRDIVTGKKLPGSFRAIDPKWEVNLRTITNVLLLPGGPPIYLVSGKQHGYTKAQLQKVGSNEKAPREDDLK